MNGKEEGREEGRKDERKGRSKEARKQGRKDTTTTTSTARGGLFDAQIVGSITLVDDFNEVWHHYYRIIILTSLF
jgi:hypothetical protein